MKTIRNMLAALLLGSVISGLAAPAVAGQSGMAMLEITMDISDQDRSAAVAVYEKYREPFLSQIEGAKSKELLVRDEDVQVLHTFTSAAAARAYLETELFAQDVVGELKPLLNADPDIRIYTRY